MPFSRWAIIESGRQQTDACRMQERAVAGCSASMPELPGNSVLEASFGVSVMNMSGFPFRTIPQ